MRRIFCKLHGAQPCICWNEMEILWCAKAPRADIYSQFVSALRTTAGCVKRRSRRAGSMCPAAKYALLPAGHAGPALQGAAVAWGGQGRPPLHVLCGTSGTPSPAHLVIASQSAPRSKCPWGTDWRGNPFSQRSPPLTNRLGWV